VTMYRFFYLTRDNTILSREESGHADDSAAIAYASALNSTREIEIWEAERCIGIVPAFVPEVA
jgi:hypothetical protein